MWKPSGREQGQLHALLVAGASRQDLDELARFDLDVILDTIGGDRQTPYREVVFRFLDWVDKHGLWVMFLNALSERMRHNRQVVGLCERLLDGAGAAACTTATWTIPLTVTIRVQSASPWQR
jgi:hypothetical protein